MGCDVASVHHGFATVEGGKASGSQAGLETSDLGLAGSAASDAPWQRSRLVLTRDVRYPAGHVAMSRRCRTNASPEGGRFDRRITPVRPPACGPEPLLRWIQGSRITSISNLLTFVLAVGVRGNVAGSPLSLPLQATLTDLGSFGDSLPSLAPIPSRSAAAPESHLEWGARLLSLLRAEPVSGRSFGTPDYLLCRLELSSTNVLAVHGILEDPLRLREESAPAPQPDTLALLLLDAELYDAPLNFGRPQEPGSARICRSPPRPVSRPDVALPAISDRLRCEFRIVRIMVWIAEDQIAAERLPSRV